MICDKCKTEISDTVKFCPKCGNKIELKKPQENQVIKCPQCGTDNPATAKFCKEDGCNLQQPRMVPSEKNSHAEKFLLCPVCGTENSLNAKFCKKDGAALAGTKTAAAEMRVQGMQENKSTVEISGPSYPQSSAGNTYVAVQGGKEEMPLNDNSKYNPPIKAKTKDKRSNKWIWIALISIVVIISAVAGALYYSGHIGMTPSRAQKIINDDLRSKGYSVSVNVSDKGVAEVEGAVNSDIDRDAVFNIIKSNKYIKVIDCAKFQISPAGDSQGSAQADPSLPEETSPQTLPEKFVSSGSSGSPDTAKLEEDINRAFIKAGIRNVTAEVRDNMNVVVKGSVRNNTDKQRALRIVNGFRQVRGITDLIFVVG